MTEAQEKSQVAVSISNVGKRFGAAAVLRDITFEVNEGETIVLLGASGSGKTTILRIIAGLEMPDTGRVILHGKDVTEIPARQRGVGVIFQSYALFPKMNVERNISYGLRLRRQPKDKIAGKVDELIRLVHLEDHRRKYPSQLSGGQQQRVAIARALAYQPEVLLFDEPFGALDAQIRTTLRREIRALLKEINVPALFITHDQEEALELGDRIGVLNAGILEQIGTPFDVYNKPETEYVATFLGAANLLLGVIRDNRFELESLRLPVKEDSNRLRDGQSVKLVFRPEDVQLTADNTKNPDTYSLSDGVIEEIHFVGAYERLTIRLNLPARPPIAVTRAKAEAAALPLAAGDKVGISLLNYRLLPNLTLASERAAKMV